LAANFWVKYGWGKRKEQRHGRMVGNESEISETAERGFPDWDVQKK